MLGRPALGTRYSVPRTRTRVLHGLAYDRVQLDSVPLVRLGHAVAEVVVEKLAAVLVPERQLRGPADKRGASALS